MIAKIFGVFTVKVDSLSPVIVLLFFSVLILSKSIRITKKRGLKTSSLIEEKYSVISNFFNSISEIKILDKKNIFFDEFNKKISQYESVHQDNSMMTMLNRPLFEILSIVGVCTSVFYLFFYNLSIQQIIPLMSLVALTLIRILPSVSSFFSSITH